MKSFSLGALRGELNQALPDSIRGSHIVAAALDLAFEAHDGQFRTSQDASQARIPYIVHPVGVAKIAIALWIDEELPDKLETVVCAALTHDVLEDSSVDYEAIASKTNDRCAELVLHLTKPQTGREITRRERNQIFSIQIQAAGPSAIYLKACDALHNLSRPETMPTSLLKKTISKISNSYLPLLDGLPFKERMLEKFSDLLWKADIALAHRQHGTITRNFESSDEFIELCLALTNEKALETHDISAFLSTFQGVLKCIHGEPATVIHESTIAVEPGVNLAEIEALLPEGELILEEPLLISETLAQKATRVVSIAFQNHYPLQTNSTPLVILLDGSPESKNLTFPLLKAGVSILSQKLNAARFQEILNLSAHLQHIDLQLTAEQATEHHLTYQQIHDLSLLIDVSTYILENLEKTTQRCLEANRNSLTLERFEARVKTPLSILRKLRSRNQDCLDDLDDMVGLRLVFLSPIARDKFASDLSKHLKREPSDLSFPIHGESFDLLSVHSNFGYKATHLKFAVPSPNGRFKAIGCEIQLRTLHEDAWARVSEHFIYKKAGLSKKLGKNLLKELAEKRDSADALMQAMVNS